MVLHEGGKEDIFKIRDAPQLFSFCTLRPYVLKCWLVIEGLGTDISALTRLFCVARALSFNTESFKLITSKINIMRTDICKSHMILNLFLEHISVAPL